MSQTKKSLFAPRALFAASAVTFGAGVIGLAGQALTFGFPAPHHDGNRANRVGRAGHARTDAQLCVSRASIHSAATCLSNVLHALRSGENAHASEMGEYEGEMPLWSVTAWSGKEYGVLMLLASEHPEDGTNLFFVRVDRSGKQVGRGVKLTSDASLKLTPALTWSGQGWVIGWTETDQQSYVTARVAWLDASGAMKGAPVNLAPRDALSALPALAPGENNRVGVAFARTNEEMTELHIHVAVRGQDGGTPSDRVVAKPAMIGGEFSFSGDGTAGYALAYTDVGASSPYAALQRVPREGALPGAIKFPLSARNEDVYSVTVTARGALASVVFDSGFGGGGSGSLSFARVDGAKVEVPASEIKSVKGSLPSLAFGGDTFGLALDGGELGAAPASFVTLNSRGVAGKPFVLGKQGELSVFADVAAGDHEYGVTYTALTQSGVSVRFLRFDERGAPRGEAQALRL